MIKAKTTKQIIFVEESVKVTRRIIEMKMTDQSKSHDAVLTNVKENDLLIENCFLCHKSDHTSCYDSSYAPMLIAMLMTMLMTMFLTIVDRSSLDYRVVSKSTLFRVSLCSSKSYR